MAKRLVPHLTKRMVEDVVLALYQLARGRRFRLSWKTITQMRRIKRWARTR